MNSGTVEAYYYKTGKNAALVGCRDVVISKVDLQTALSEMIMVQVILLCTKEHMLKTEKRKRGLAQDIIDLSLGILQEISKVEKLRIGLYEQYKQGKFDKVEFTARKEFEAKKEELVRGKEQKESEDEMLKK